jgi:phosphopantetheinyl transferase (holo-ACP synthase)
VIIEKILDLATNKETIVEREATPDEIAYATKIANEKAIESAEVAAKEAAKATVLEKLGLTAEEAAALLS